MVLGVFGAGGLGREVNIVARKINDISHNWKEIIYIDDDETIKNLLGVPCYTLSTALDKYGNQLEAVIAIGEPSTRELIYNKLVNLGVKIATLIHPGVYVDETTKIGKGCIICEGVTITSNVTLEEDVYVHPHAVIGHDIYIEKHCMIGANSEIGGADHIGTRTYMGFLSGTKEGLKIGKDVIISAGAIVFRNIEDNLIVVGNPARPMKRNEGQGVFHRRNKESKEINDGKA